MLAIWFVIVALGVVIEALASTPATILADMLQVVDVDELAWGRAGAIVLALLLLLVARALARGKRQAWLLSVALVVASFTGAIAEHAHLQSLLLILLALAVLLGLGPAFTRRSDTVSSIRGHLALALGGWLTWGHAFLYHAILAGRVVLQASPWVILFPVRILSYTILTIGLWQLLRPVLSQRAGARLAYERARALVERFGSLSTAYFAATADKSFVWSLSGESFLPYCLRRGVALALSDPIGPPLEHAQTIDAFLTLCRRQDWVPAMYQVSPTLYQQCRELGWWGFKIGEEALIDLSVFTVTGPAGAPVRHSVTRATRGGLSVHVYHGERPPDHIFAGMRRVSESWLHARQVTRQYHFCMGRFPDDWSPDLLTLVALGPDDAVQAFVTWTPLYSANGWALDVMRRDMQAVSGAMELLIAGSCSWARTQGFVRMSLGLAPLAGLAVRPSGALVERGAAYLHRHGLLLAHYRSLRRFKEKFQPRWEPRYLLTPEVSRVPQVTAALLVALDGNWRTMALDAWHGRRKKNLDTTGPTLDLE